MSQPFDEVRFPTNVAFTSTGGPMRQTQIVIMGSGAEARNARWQDSKRAYDIVYGQKSLDDIYTVAQFFEARNAKLIGFRFKDHADFQSCSPLGTVTPLDQLIAIGASPAHQTQFPLTKTYASGPSSWTRNIKKPVANTVRIAINGVEQLSGWSVDTTTGIVTLNTYLHPGSTLHAGFQFDVPVRFDTDKLVIEHKDFKVAYIQSLPLVELLLP